VVVTVDAAAYARLAADGSGEMVGRRSDVLPADADPVAASETPDAAYSDVGDARVAHPTRVSPHARR
jgi:hypothetical protein